jgi:hypothetical protein
VSLRPSSKFICANESLNHIAFYVVPFSRRVGDRLGVAPTEHRSSGFGEEFRIMNIAENGNIVLDKPSEHDHAAEFIPPAIKGTRPALKSAEVMNLSRNIVITGDDFSQEVCDPTLPESVLGEETSTNGCRCSSFRNTCTFGLHTAAMHGGVARIQNTRIEKCGQRGKFSLLCSSFHFLLNVNALHAHPLKLLRILHPRLATQVWKASTASTFTNCTIAQPVCSRTTLLKTVNKEA